MAVTAGLAGRRRELRTVANVLTGAADVAALLVVGEAGIGKSRLVTAAASTAPDAGVTVLSGWCLPLSDGLPFLPIIDVLRGLGDVDGALKSALSKCPPHVRGEVVRLLPELEEPGERRPGEPDDAWRRQRLLDALRQLVNAAGQLRRLAIVIEDVHWGDRATMELLDYLFAPGHAAGVPLVVTCRGEEAAAADWLDRAQRNIRVRRLDLAPLTRTETGEQIELLTGKTPTPAFVDETYRRSEGNAFFTEQLVSSDDEQTDATLPAGLTSLLLSRTAQVTGTAREVLDALAVAARPLDESALIHVGGHAESDMRSALRDLLSRRLLRRPDTTGRHQLRHALLGEAISANMLPDARRELHAKIAELLCARHDRALAAPIAEHYAAAGRTTDELRWRVIAAQEAQTVFASKEAAGQWQRVLSLWDNVPGAQTVTGVDLAQVYLWATAATESAGHLTTAAALAEQALTRLEATASPQTVMNLLRTVGMYRTFESAPGGITALARALEIGERLPPSTDYVKALCEYTRMLGYEGRYEEQRAATTEGIRAAQQAGDFADERRLLLGRARSALIAGDRANGLADVERALQIVVEPEDPVAEGDFVLHYAILLDEIGDLDGVVAAGLPALARAERSAQADSLHMQNLRHNICAVLTELGDIDRAAAIIDPVTDGTPNFDSIGSYEARADLDMRRGRLTAAAKYWYRNTDLIAATQFHKSAMAFDLETHLELDLWLDPTATLAQALAILDDFAGTDIVIETGALFALALRACADLAETARANGDNPRLYEIERDSNRLAHIYAAAKSDPFAERPLPVTGPAHGLSWHAEWTRLRGDSDPTAWEKAATAWDALSRPHRAAYARWRQAEALLARPQSRTAATPVLRIAAQQAAQYVPLTNAVHDLARRARINVAEPRTPEVPQPGPTRNFGLTERELAVLALVGQGRTNSEIGAALFISRKTASVHVSNILRKLDVTTRVQAAMVADRAGLLAPDKGSHRST